MTKKRIFVSCGQRTKKEKEFGKDILKVVDDHKMDGFFAEEVHEAADLNQTLFKKLQHCDGFVAVLQKRGEVRYAGFPVTHRASVWIQQEIGILFYRSFLLNHPIPMRVYAQKGVFHEGLTSVSIINPIEFRSPKYVLKNLSEWLESEIFKEEPALARRESMFKSRVQNLDADDWLILELVAALSPAARAEVARVQVAKDYKPGGRQNKISEDFNDRLGKLESFGLLRIPKGDTIIINPVWWDLLWQEFRNQGRTG